MFKFFFWFLYLGVFSFNSPSYPLRSSLLPPLSLVVLLLSSGVLPFASLIPCGPPLILWGLTISHYVLSYPTMSYGIPLYPIVSHYVLWCSTVSYRVRISWIIHVSHVLIYNVIFRGFSLQNRFIARLGIRSGVSESEDGCLHHYTIATGLERYIFFRVFKPILLPKIIKKKRKQQIEILLLKKHGKF